MLPRMDNKRSLGELLPSLLGGTVPQAPAFSPLRCGMWESRERDLFHSETLSAKQIFNKTGLCSGLEDVAESLLDRMHI